ncbi:zinc ribbon domain-containing protein [Planococcus lenghuensis]|uniref:DZANK-type domain-containing protein n=1 Tax=Planococcus lenghuensis TaxID=2213202 RepID=A0A1Q2L136_9BACL|nr:zinc ribbon domain-containing protein [Planococcus lenghuensis]AQQ54168.1 hypothetical protein B0X71_14345 [Planococcus lenghuensis]
MQQVANKTEQRRYAALKTVEVHSDQEAGQLEKTVDKLRTERQHLIFRMGDKMHRELRLQRVINPDFAEYSEAILDIDKKIYKLGKEQAMRLEAEQTSCQQCGSKILNGSKFCGSCGTPVQQLKKTIEETRDCRYCAETVPASAQFCPCCGSTRE